MEERQPRTHRPRYLYQLTPEGEAAELALAACDKALGNHGELQSVALEDICLRLRSLRQQVERWRLGVRLGAGIACDMSIAVQLAT